MRSVYSYDQGVLILLNI